MGIRPPSSAAMVMAAGSRTERAVVANADVGCEICTGLDRARLTVMGITDLGSDPRYIRGVSKQPGFQTTQFRK